MRLTLVPLLLLAACGGGGEATGPGTTPPPPPPPPPTGTPTLTLTILTAASETNPANDLPTEAMGVRATDSTGAPVKDVSLTWTVTTGGGHLVQVPAATDSLGRAFALWALGPSAAPQVLTVTHEKANAAVAFAGYVPIGSVTATPGLARAYVGDALGAYATVKDTKGTTLTGPSRVVVRDTLVAADVGAGALVGRGEGATYVVFVTGPQNTPKDSVRVDVYRELHGTVYTYDASPLPALRAYSTNGTVTDSADVAPNGTYRIRLTSHITGWVSEVLIDAVNTANRAWFPALMPVAADCSVRSLPNCIGSDITADISFVLVPTQYTVKRGKYVGQTLAVNPDVALGTTTSPLSFLFASGQYQQPITAGGSAPRVQTTYSAAEFAWLPDSLPVAVVMHRACCSTHAVTAADSVAVMGALNDVQATLGYPIWHAADDHDAYKGDYSSATPNRTLIFQYDSTLKGAITGGGGTNAINSATNAAVTRTAQDFVVTGWRNSKVDHVSVTDQMSQAQIIGYNPTALALNHDVLVHEAMHALGAGHGCGWASTQSSCGTPTADGLPSFEDAAYLLLAMDVKAAVWKNHALHSLTAALFGQRAIMLKVDPIPVVKHDGGDSSGDAGP